MTGNVPTRRPSRKNNIDLSGRNSFHVRQRAARLVEFETALVSAYKASPYFDHYAPRFEPFYTRRYEFLFDYDLRLMETIAELLGLPMPAVSEAYLTADEGDLDLRPKRKEGADFASPPYIQVFSDRLPFTPNLSIADLLFCEGPQSPALLKQCRL